MYVLSVVVGGSFISYQLRAHARKDRPSPVGHVYGYV
jgi:hypothetical protein